MFAVLLSTLVLAAADPTPASPASPEPAAEPSAKGGKDAKRSEMVCRYEKPTGSHMIERVCFTREEVDQAEQSAQGAMNSINRRTKASANAPK